MKPKTAGDEGTKRIPNIDQPYIEPNWDTITPEENERNTCEVARRFFASGRKLRVEGILGREWISLPDPHFDKGCTYRITPTKKKVSVTVRWYRTTLGITCLVEDDAAPPHWTFLSTEEKEFEI